MKNFEIQEFRLKNLELAKKVEESPQFYLSQDILLA
jgi:hypothetical protein